jgi:FkbM family methyltransferase
MIDPLASRFPNIRGARRAAGLWSSFAGAVGLPPCRTVPMRLGHKLILDRRSITERGAFYFGRYDDEQIDNICCLLAKESYFIDVGANVGFFSIAVGLRCKQKRCRVLAFEPAPGNFARLKKNIALNGLEDIVVVVRAGLSSAQGTAALTLREDYASGSSTGNASIQIDDGADKVWNKVEVPIITLDDYWKNEPIGLIKVDIEGHEDEFLRGAQGALLACRPIIYLEVNNVYFKRKNKSLDAACEYLVGVGYSKWREKWWEKKGSIPEPVQNLDTFTTLENVWMVPEEATPAFLDVKVKSGSRRLLSRASRLGFGKWQ